MDSNPINVKGKTVNERVKYLRKLRGFTQKEFADKLNISLYKYSKLERNGHIRDQLMLDIAAILEVNPRYILLGDTMFVKETSYRHKLFDESLTPLEENAIIELRLLKKEQQDFIFEIIDSLYYKRKYSSRF